jgi:hypothetical protein
MWGYLQEFWAQLQTITTNAWEYPASWFESVGNAVAGAVGNLFGFVLHFINDIGVLIGWIGTTLTAMFLLFFLPLQYIFLFLKNFFISAFSAPVSPEHFYTFSPEILGVFNAIPFWQDVGFALGVALGVLFVFFVLKTILKTR